MKARSQSTRWCCTGVAPNQRGPFWSLALVPRSCVYSPRRRRGVLFNVRLQGCCVSVLKNRWQRVASVTNHSPLFACSGGAAAAALMPEQKKPGGHHDCGSHDQGECWKLTPYGEAQNARPDERGVIKRRDR